MFIGLKLRGDLWGGNLRSPDRCYVAGARLRRLLPRQSIPVNHLLKTGRSLRSEQK